MSASRICRWLLVALAAVVMAYAGGMLRVGEPFAASVLAAAAAALGMAASLDRRPL